jgi:uncharacterized protein (TIGR02453 family)
MISTDTFQFLKELRRNNHKEWFDQNRSVYQTQRNDFEYFLNMVIGEIAGFDREAAQTTAKASIFRINRDIRFSNDKLPYKTNFGAFIAKGGRKGINAGYYIHVEPGECFLAGGIYMPSAPVLKAIRTEIYDNAGEYLDIISAPDFRKHFGNELSGEKLRTAPKGFPKDFPHIDHLKYKHYTVSKKEPDAVYQSPAFIKEVTSVFKAMMPFNRYLNAAVTNA